MFKLFNFANLKDLFNIALLYANPILTASLRTRRAKAYAKNPKAIYKDLFLKNYIVAAVVIAFIYTMFFAQIDFIVVPKFFDLIFLFSMGFAFVNGLTVFFNVFYESKDLNIMLALPIEDETLFLSRLLVAVMGIFQFGGTLFPLFFCFFYRLSVFWPVAIVYALIYSFVMLILLAIVNVFLMQLMVKISIFIKYKKIIISTLMLLCQIGFISLIIALSQLIHADANKLEKHGFGEVGPLSGLLGDAHLRMTTLVVLMAIIVVFSVLIYFTVVKKFRTLFYSVQDDKQSSKKTRHIKKFKPKSLKVMVLRYHLKLIADINVIGGMISAAVFPIFVCMPLVMAIGELDAYLIKPSYSLLISLSIATALALYDGLIATNLSAVILSLEGRNLIHLKSLPSLAHYLFYKYAFSTVVGGLPSAIILIGLLLYAKLTAYIFLSLLMFFLVHSAVSALWFRFDLMHLTLDWLNVLDIYNRTSKLMTTLILFGGMIFTGLLGFIIGLCAYFIDPLVAVAVLVTVVVLFVSLVGFIMRHTFSHNEWI